MSTRSIQKTDSINLQITVAWNSMKREIPSTLIPKTEVQLLNQFYNIDQMCHINHVRYKKDPVQTSGSNIWGYTFDYLFGLFCFYKKNRKWIMFIETWNCVNKFYVLHLVGCSTSCSFHLQLKRLCNTLVKVVHQTD